MKRKMSCFLGVCLCVSVYAQSVTINATSYSGKENPWANSKVGSGVMALGEGNPNYVPMKSIWYNSFQGQSGKYKIVLHGSMDDDCASDWELYAADRLLKTGKFLKGGGDGYTPYTYDLGGGYTVNNGEKITFRANSTGKCYSRWSKLVFTLESAVNPPPPPPPPGPATKITAPTSTTLDPGQEYTFTGEGDELQWTYDVSGDGQGAFDMGSGASIQYTFPATLAGKTLTITLSGANGTDSKTYTLNDLPVIVYVAPRAIPQAAYRGAVELFDISGKSLGVYASASDARRAMAKYPGVVIARAGVTPGPMGKQVSISAERN